MRSLLITLLAILMAPGLACTEGGLAEPISLPPLLPTVTPLPAASPLPAATELPTPTAEAPAVDLPTNTPLPAATELPTIPPLVAVEQLPAATELPTALPAPAAPVIPTMAPTVAPTAVPTPDPSVPLVTIGDVAWPVELAITPGEKSQGLSGRETLPEGTGMLFIYEEDRRLSFWMPDMHFPLDMVWIDSSCQVVDVTLNAPIPEPGQDLGDLPTFSPQSLARFVLEINAGEFHGRGASVGENVRFQGALAGQHGC